MTPTSPVIPEGYTLAHTASDGSALFTNVPAEAAVEIDGEFLVASVQGRPFLVVPAHAVAYLIVGSEQSGGQA